MSASQGVTTNLRGGSDEAARLFPQQRGLPGQDRAESQGAAALSTCRITFARANNARPPISRSIRRGWCRRWRTMPARCSPSRSPSSNGWTRPIPNRRCCRRIRCAAPRCAPSRMALACDTHPGAESESAGAAAPARRARGKGDGVGGLGQPRGARRLRNPDRGRARAVLLRRQRRPWPISAWCRSLRNARRFGVDVSAYPRLLKAEAAAKEMKAFADAAPDKQPDAE